MSTEYHTLSFRVVGIPQPQGSARAFVTRAGRAIVTSDNAKLRPWRDSVTAAAIEAREAAGWETVDGPVDVYATLWLPRPSSHYGRGGLLNSAPTYPARKPDIDKLVRSFLDSLTDAAVWRDDAQVVRVDAGKLYATTEELVGLDVSIRELRA